MWKHRVARDPKVRLSLRGRRPRHHKRQLSKHQHPSPNRQRRSNRLSPSPNRERNSPRATGRKASFTFSERKRRTHRFRDREFFPSAWEPLTSSNLGKVRFVETPKRARSPRRIRRVADQARCATLTAALTRSGSRAWTRSCSRGLAPGDGSLGRSGSR